MGSMRNPRLRVVFESLSVRLAGMGTVLVIDDIAGNAGCSNRCLRPTATLCARQATEPKRYGSFDPNTPISS